VRQYVEEVGVKNVTWSDANDSAFAFAMAQNDPSGDLSPADVELRLTRRILEAGKIL